MESRATKIRKSMNQISKEQSDAIRHLAGSCIVIAPPGSGKTFVLTKRISYLVNERGINPSSVLVITFTRAAALEMKTRFLKEVNEEDTTVTFGTFHSVFYMMLRTSFGTKGQAIISDNDKVELLDSLIRSLFLEDIEKPEVFQVAAEISRMKNMGVPCSEYRPQTMDTETFAKIYDRYQSAMANKNKFDYDDLIIKCRDELQTHPETLKYWQKRFEYILVDEFQDINKPQFDIVKMLAMPQNNVFFVGDDDQSIYSFRGANPKTMLDIANDYPNIRKIYLKKNYRSTNSILNMGTELISHNVDRFKKEIECNTSDLGYASFACLPTDEKQIETVVNQILKWKDYSNTAIITRNNLGVTKYAHALSARGIPFVTSQKISSPYSHPVVQDVISYLKMSVGCGKLNDLIRIINKPYRGVVRKMIPDVVLGNEAIDYIFANYASDATVYSNMLMFRKQLQNMRGFTPFAAINYIKLGTGYMDYLRKKYQGSNDEEGYEEAVHIVNLLQDMSKNTRDTVDFINRMEQLGEDKNNQKEHPLKKTKEGVALVTMHGSKGLEYENVILPDLNDHTIPGRHAILPSQIEEERRILYVAITRAKQNLLLTGIHKKGEQGKELSRFIQDLPQMK